MSERKFSRGLCRPGMAAQLRESVSQVVRESAVQNKLHLVEPLDFENYILKNKTILQNDPQRELLLYPSDDISQTVWPKKIRTVHPTSPPLNELQDCSLFSKECLKTYNANWNAIHYKYSAYSGSYLELPKILKSDELKDEVYEVDTDLDQLDDDEKRPTDGVSKEGYLMKGPEVGSDKMFPNIGSKSFKRRYCYLRREVDGTYILELHKDEKKGEAKDTIVMDFCYEVVKNNKKGKLCFELHMTAGHKSFCLAAESEQDVNDWISKLQLVLQQNRLQEEKRAGSLERTCSTSSLPQTPNSETMLNVYGTLRGLEQSVNPQLMKYARETDTSISLARKENRRRLFSVYPFMPHTKVANPNEVAEPFREHFGQRILVKCLNLRFRLQAAITSEKDAYFQIEPYFLVISLFDVREGRKLTEDFHWEVSCDAVTGMILPPDGPTLPVGMPDGNLDNWLDNPTQAIFSVSNVHSEIYIVVRIEKILQGSIAQAAEPYMRTAKDPKLGFKVHKTIQTSAQRLGKYRMPFGWTARPLFRLYSNEPDTVSDFSAIYRQEPGKLKDEELIKTLAEFRKPDKLGKLPVIPGWLQIKVELLNDIPQNTLTSGLNPLKPFPLPPSSEPTLEVAELAPKIYPYTYFYNHLYIYPQSLLFDTQKSFNRARNIACVVQIKDSDSITSQPIPCIYGRRKQGEFVSWDSCCILHHNTTPSWYDEIKIRLPTCILPSHHILFTFYHISVEGSKKKDTGLETPVGYVWVPLLNKNRLNLDEQTLPVAANLPPGYLSVQPLGLGKGFSGPEVVWIDGQRSLFTVSFSLLSTVHTMDQHLHNLFSHAEKLHSPKTVPPPDIETCKILKATHAVQLNSAIAFLPTVLNQLFSLLVKSPSHDVATNIIRLLIHIVSMVHGSDRSETLNTYVKFVFVGESSNGRTVHEELANHLPSLLYQNNTDFLIVNKFLSHSGFFFQVMVKSMAQHLLNTGRIKMHRHERFQAEFLSKIENLLNVLNPYLLSKYREMPQETKQLNTSIANFLKRCLSFLDRGFVLKLIAWYVSTFSGEARILHDLKYTFINIICSHEHYVAFNLPLLRIKGRNNDGCDYWLSEEFCKQHYLAGLLLLETKSALNQESTIRHASITTLRDLLAKHELDDRYQSKGQLARIAALYIPWLGIVVENLQRLTDITQTASPGVSSAASSVISTPSKPPHRFTFHQDSVSLRTSLNVRDSTYLAAIAGPVANGTDAGSKISLDSQASTVSGDGTTISQETAIHREGENIIVSTKHARSVSGTQATPVLKCDKLLPSEVKDILICFLFVLKHLSHDQIISWWHNCTQDEILSFFKIIQMCLHEFKYTGRRQIANETENSSAASMNPVVNRRAGSRSMTLPARMQPPDFTNDAEKTGNNTPVTNNYHHPLLSGSNSIGRESAPLRDSESSSLYQALLEANLATEVGLTVLDTLGLYCLHFRDILMSDGGDNPVMSSLFNLYLSFLQVGQSETLFRHVFAALRAFINNFSKPLFQGNATLCGQLCLELLRCCNSRLSAIRQESCAILYLLMRSNFEFSSRKGLTRVHLQVIISVSQLLGNIVGLNNARFQESLSLINSYATSDKVMKGTGFPTEVKDLTKRIRTVLMATAQMKELHHEPEVLTDLQHSLANSYASTPELRFTWLQTMTRNHSNLANYSEAACCQLHIAALMAQYLKLKGEQDWGAEAFSPISANIIRDETSLKLDSGVQDVQYTEQGLVEQLEVCAELLEKAERYECLYFLYNLILPIYQRRRDYTSMSRAYFTLSQAIAKINAVQGKRLLGRYYRVVFYNQAFFDKESGVEYIYKEPKLTSLSEISERLMNQYSNKFGAGAVKIIMDSAPVVESDLDNKIAYIQVTSVVPYWEKAELVSRQTDFEQNHNVDQFMYETPFTKEGKPRGTPAEQHKRRTILTTDYVFPYVKKRLKVVKRVEYDLSPIEVALDEMHQRVAELEEVVFTKPPDVKKLQLKLQGSVCVQVNAGPLAYANAFLDPDNLHNYPEEKVEELKDIFREFIRVCYAALQLNSKLVRSDQTEYQMALRQNLHKMAQDLSNMFSETLWPDSELGSFKRNSQALFSAISGASSNSSSA
ncbi:dedicator of cytokinesis protein 9 isoform X2 [Cimex lectularius]|uniref:Dedicator of cytokinesis protein 9 n=1 Tax=Cimex lectularius TaxID=79782 RepID=A0A8I6SPY3_CIMLE|nr:dedicator of cytokinesis protein 9 isoform X2 [Cimex lectularius]